MDLSPSPTPIPVSNKCGDADNTDAAQYCVIMAVLAMFLLHVLGSLRRRSSNTLLHSTVMGVHTLSYPLVSTTIVLMRYSSLHHKDFTVWAVFLLLLLGSTDSLTIYCLSDVDNWKSIHLKHVRKGLWLVLLILVILPRKDKLRKHPYMYPLYAILSVIILKGYVGIASMRMVSKSYIWKKVKVIAEYMRHNSNLPGPFDPVTMEGYRYIVAGEKNLTKRQDGVTPWYKGDDSKVITVEEIWQCTGRLLVLEKGKLFKDLCLSMALSKMLNRRFVGFRLPEVGREKTHDFVLKGLLAGDKPHQRAFKVIEEELVFVHDMYYTRYSYFYQKGRYFILCLPIAMLALCSWFTYQLLKNHYETLSEVHTTIFVTVVVALLEAYQLYLYMSSGWFKVSLIQSYINTPFLRTSRCLEMIIGLLLRLKAAFAPWKQSLGQYCILNDLGHENRVRKCLHYASLRLVDKVSRKELKKVKLAENVKKAIVDSLLARKQQWPLYLTNGVTSLQNNRVHGLQWACDSTATDGAVSRTILVWHIATTLCEQKLAKQAKEDDAVKTASTLSKYCMHLLAFAPDLLPDHSSVSESILHDVMDEADLLFKKAKNLKIKGKNKKIEGRCEILTQIISTDDDCVGGETRLIAQGVQLARQIEGIPDLKRWTVLSDFWAEMMLYVSPSDDARSHLEVLARGGEFITHLWALLTHAGVLKRPTGPNDIV